MAQCSAAVVHYHAVYCINIRYGAQGDCAVPLEALELRVRTKEAQEVYETMEENFKADMARQSNKICCIARVGSKILADINSVEWFQANNTNEALDMRDTVMLIVILNKNAAKLLELSSHARQVARNDPDEVVYDIVLDQYGERPLQTPVHVKPPVFCYHQP